MYLLISIVLSTILGCVLMVLGPIGGGVVAFGIIVGCLFRGLYLLNKIFQKISVFSSEEPFQDHLESARAYKKYLKEKSNRSLS